MTIELKCSEKELNEVASGKKKIVTREIRPGNARKFVFLDDEECCTGIVPYDTIRLVCEKQKASLTAKIEKAMLMEIEDEDGQLVYYELNGTTYQMVDIDYHLGEVSDITGFVPNV